MTKGAKLARALALRDAALKVLGRVGSGEAVESIGRHQMRET
jgi:hypothetical protein